MKNLSYDSDKLLAGSQNLKQREYWVDKFKSQLTGSSFPYDLHGDVSSGNNCSKSYDVRFSGPLYDRLQKVSARSHHTLHVILSAGLIALVARYTGNAYKGNNIDNNSDILLGTPIYKQEIGENLLNTVLILRSTIEPRMSFKDLLMATKKEILLSVENQDFPIDILSQRLNLHLFDTETPLADIYILLSQLHDPSYIQQVPANVRFHFSDTGQFLELSICYNPKRYTHGLVEQIASHYRQLLENAMFRVDIPLTDIEILSPTERQRLLVEFNRTDSRLTIDETILRLFQKQVRQAPGSIAVVVPMLELNDSAASNTQNLSGINRGLVKHSVSYGFVEQKSRIIAQRLKKNGARPGDIVGIQVDRSLEMITAIFAVWWIGASYLPIDPDYPSERIKFMLKDSNAVLLITHPPYITDYGKSFSILDISDLSVTSTAISQSESENSWLNAAYVTYTSGSTGKPKGVVIQHRSLVNYLKGITAVIPFKKSDTILSLTTIAFDIFGTELFCPLTSGAKVILGNREEQLIPSVTVDVFRKESVSIFQTTPSRLTLILSNPFSAGLLSSINYLMIGGEAFPPALLQRLKSIVKGKIFNMYGPTETTIWSTCKDVSGGQRLDIGKPIANTRIYITDKNLSLQPIGLVGQICIAGDGLAPGYLNRPLLTSEKFQQLPWFPKERIYMTGDLGRWLPDGNIEIVGRIDHQIKLRGYRIELGDIENHITGHPNIKDAAVILATDSGEEQCLCAYYSPTTGTDAPSPEQIRNFLGKRLPDYMIPSAFVPLNKLPLTLNGKIDRKHLPPPDFETFAQLYTPPRNERERKLIHIWSDVLSLDVKKIGIDHNFYHCGGNSLKATTLLSRIQQTFNVKIRLAQILKISTIRDIIHLIEEVETFPNTPDPTIAGMREQKAGEDSKRNSLYSLSSSQKRLYILHQLSPDTTGYNIPLVVKITGEFQKANLERALRELVKRHESFRTSFTQNRGEPFQKIHPDVPFRIEDIEIPAQFLSRDESSTVESVIHRFIKPFDLTRPPLIRAGLLTIDAPGHLHYLIIDIHHIIFDGLSLEILCRELAALYSRKPLPPLNFHYKDYVEWLEQPEQKERMHQQEKFWMDRFQDDIPVLSLPVDFQRPAIQKFEGDQFLFHIEGAETGKLKKIARNENATLFMSMFALYHLLLSRIAQQSDIIIGTPVAGRNHPDLNGIIGVFINTLPLRIASRFDMTFHALIHETKDRILDALSNQDYPYESLVKALNIERPTDRNPLFDTMFTMQTMDSVVITLPGLTMEPVLYKHDVSKFDLSFFVNLSPDPGEQTLTCGFEYSTSLFKKETIERFASFFRRILSQVLREPDITINRISIVTEKEKQQVLYDFNRTYSPYDHTKTVHQLFEEQVEKTPDRIALFSHSILTTFFQNRPGHDLEVLFSYRQLDRCGGEVARRIYSSGAKPGSIVAYMVESSLEMIICLLGILKAGCAYLPVSPRDPRDRVAYILADSHACILLTGSHHSPIELPKYVNHLSVQSILNPESCSVPASHLPSEGFFLNPPIQPDSLAYVIYTSGTTGKPKGVVVEHSNVVAYLNAFFRELRIHMNDTVLQQASYTFDLFVEEVFPVLLTGGKLSVPPMSHTADIARLVERIQKHCITVLDCTPLMLSAFNAYAEPDEQNNPLRYTRLFISGGDVLKPSHIDKLRRFGTVYNTYGPTETTVCATFYRLPQMSTNNCSTAIPIGSPIGNYVIYILDNTGYPVPVHIAGELHITGDGVARGYLNRPQLTAEKFAASHSLPILNSTPLYKTGDLGRWLPDGNIEYLGRKDHQVKIRGIRIELEEIENRLLEHKHIEKAVADFHETRGDRSTGFLCAYIVATPESPVAENAAEQLSAFLAQTLPDYMIPLHYIVLESIPMTMSGKVNRRALPRPEATVPRTAYVPPGDEVEEAIVEMWSRILGIHRDRIGIHDNFFKLGGHSLNATLTAAQIHKRFHVDISLTEIFSKPTVNKLSQHVKNFEKNKFVAIPIAEKKTYYPVSSAQKRFYILQQMDDAGTAYNIPSIQRIRGHIDTSLMEESFRRLIRRHETLRTAFIMKDDQPVQVVRDEASFSLKIVSASTEEETDRAVAGFIRPFRLSEAPLMRVGLIRLHDLEQILVIDMHHIISDGFSTGILVKDLLAFYSGELLPPLPIQYKDASQWQSTTSYRQRLKDQESFWLEQYKTPPPILSLLTDYSRPSVQNFDGDQVDFIIGQETVRRLKTFAHENDVTLFMAILAFYNILLSKLAGQDDIVVGTPAVGRTHKDLQSIVGIFAGTLALRNFPTATKSLNAFIQEVKTNTLEALANQDYPFEELVERLDIIRDAGRNPLFDTMLAFQDMNVTDFHVPGLSFSNYHFQAQTAKFDIAVSIGEEREELHVILEYSTKLFKKETINRFIGYFKHIVHDAPLYPHRELEKIDIVPEHERRLLMDKINGSEPAFSNHITLQELFYRQTRKTPHLIAASEALLTVDDDFRNPMHLTYEQLDREAGQLAAHLHCLGVRINHLVAIRVERSIEMLIGILGILKAGAAYVPLNPKAPAERNRYILRECNIRTVLSQRSLDKEETPSREYVYIDDYTYRSTAPEPTFGQDFSPHNLAYVIFTSGSTGKPKGVPITHANLCPLLHWGYRSLQIPPGGRALQNLSFFFDWSVWEIFFTLTSGVALVMTDRDVLLNPSRCIEFVRTNRISILHITPTQWQYIVDAVTDPLPLTYLFIGAEALSYDLVNRSFAAVDESCRLFNMYGPTEATIISAVLELQSPAYRSYSQLPSVPIGFAAGNTRLYVLDSCLNLSPILAAGELYISGDGIARGYLNDHEKTACNFIQNPFSDSAGMRLYKTGDRVCRLPDGSIRFLGRNDTQVKIRGFRIEPGEIENCILTHSLVKEAAVVPVTGENGDTLLCAYIVPRDISFCSNPSPAVIQLKQFLSGKLPGYMVPTYMVLLDGFPLNPNGKIAIRQLPDPQIGLANDSDNDNAPADPVEEKIAAIWSDLLGLPVERIGTLDNFFDLGGHSLLATILVSRIHNELNVKLPLAKFFENPTVKESAGFIKKFPSQKLASIDLVEAKEYYPMSSAQKRMFVLYLYDKQKTSDNTPQVLVAEGNLDIPRFENAFRQLIARHEPLRTSFHLFGENPVQRIHATENIDFSITHIPSIGFQDTDIQDNPKIMALIDGFIRPFDLSCAPLMRVGLVDLSPNRHLILYDLHHIIVDGMSKNIIVEDFAALYRERQLPDLRLQYKDFSIWQNRMLSSSIMKRQEDFWLEQFSGKIPVLDMPTDFPRGDIQSFDGATIEFHFDELLSEKIAELASRTGATFHMICLTLFNILLSRYCGQEDIVIGTSIAGRSHADLNRLIGFFVNTIAFRNYPAGEKTFEQLLKEVKNNCIAAYENQDYQFETLIDKLGIERVLHRNPLFDFHFTFQDTTRLGPPPEKFTGLRFTPFPFQEKTTQFDIIVHAIKDRNLIRFTLRYCIKLFKHETIETFIRLFREVADTVIETPAIRIEDIPLSHRFFNKKIDIPDTGFAF